jgi:hypothetical protein
MTYACPVWEFALDIHLSKLQRLRNKVLCTIGKFPKCTLVREFPSAGNKQRSYKIMKMQIFSTSEMVKLDLENTRDLSLAAVKRTTVQVTRQPL